MNDNNNSQKMNEKTPVSYEYNEETGELTEIKSRQEETKTEENKKHVYVEKETVFGKEKYQKTEMLDPNAIIAKIKFKMAIIVWGSFVLPILLVVLRAIDVIDWHWFIVILLCGLLYIAQLALGIKFLILAPLKKMNRQALRAMEDLSSVFESTINDMEENQKTIE